MQQPHVQPKKWEWQDCKAKIKTNNLYDQPSSNGGENENSRQINGQAYRNPEEENQYSLFNLDPSIVLTNPLKNGVSPLLFRIWHSKNLNEMDRKDLGSFLSYLVGSEHEFSLSTFSLIFIVALNKLDILSSLIKFLRKFTYWILISFTIHLYLIYFDFSF